MSNPPNVRWKNTDDWCKVNKKIKHCCGPHPNMLNSSPCVEHKFNEVNTHTHSNVQYIKCKMISNQDMNDTFITDCTFKYVRGKYLNAVYTECKY